ncbi:hypothetical protein ZWY2020_053105, partial [Hordeum vulgare]
RKACAQPARGRPRLRLGTATGEKVLVAAQGGEADSRGGMRAKRVRKVARRVSLHRGPPRQRTGRKASAETIGGTSSAAVAESHARRIRESPRRFVKLKKSLIPLQRAHIYGKVFGSLLNLAHTLPAKLTIYPVGSIRVDANNVHRVFALANKGQLVRYFGDKDSIIRFKDMFNITGNSHLEVNNNLIAKVIRKDLISPIVFGKLQYRGTEQTPILGALLQVEAFVGSKLPQTYNLGKMSELLYGLCKSMTDHLNKFIERFIKIDEEEPYDFPTNHCQLQNPWRLLEHISPCVVLVSDENPYVLMIALSYI